MGAWAEIAALAGTQHGLVASWQAGSLGVGRKQLAYRVDTHGWRRVRPGVFQLPGAALTPLARLKAAELAFGGAGIAAGRAAAYAWNLLPRLATPLDFIVRPRCSRRPAGTLVHESQWLAGHEPVLQRGILVPTPEWTICTCAPLLTVPELKRLIGLADRMRLCARSSVRQTVDANGFFHDRRKLREALAELDGEGLSHSELEALGRRRLRSAGFTPHNRPYRVEDRGRAVAELDIAFVDEKVGIPIDGPHHFEPDQKRADDDQRQKLTLLGWLIVPADEHRLKHQPQVFIRQVRQALAARGSPQVSRDASAKR